MTRQQAALPLTGVSRSMPAGAEPFKFWRRVVLIYLATFAVVFATWYGIARSEYRDALRDWLDADAAYRDAWRQETERQRADRREAMEMAQKDWQAQRAAAVAKVLAEGGTQEQAIKLLDDPERWKDLQERIGAQGRVLLDAQAAERMAFLPSQPGYRPNPPDAPQIVVGAALCALPIGLLLAWALPRRRPGREGATAGEA